MNPLANTKTNKKKPKWPGLWKELKEAEQDILVERPSPRSKTVPVGVPKRRTSYQVNGTSKTNVTTILHQAKAEDNQVPATITLTASESTSDSRGTPNHQVRKYPDLSPRRGTAEYFKSLGNVPHVDDPNINTDVTAVRTILNSSISHTHACTSVVDSYSKGGVIDVETDMKCSNVDTDGRTSTNAYSNTSDINIKSSLSPIVSTASFHSELDPDPKGPGQDQDLDNDRDLLSTGGSITVNVCTTNNGTTTTVNTVATTGTPTTTEMEIDSYAEDCRSCLSSSNQSLVNMHDRNNGSWGPTKRRAQQEKFEAGSASEGQNLPESGKKKSTATILRFANTKKSKTLSLTLKIRYEGGVLEIQPVSTRRLCDVLTEDCGRSFQYDPKIEICDGMGRPLNSQEYLANLNVKEIFYGVVPTESKECSGLATPEKLLGGNTISVVFPEGTAMEVFVTEGKTLMESIIPQIAERGFLFNQIHVLDEDGSVLPLEIPLTSISQGSVRIQPNNEYVQVFLPSGDVRQFNYNPYMQAHELIDLITSQTGLVKSNNLYDTKGTKLKIEDNLQQTKDRFLYYIITPEEGRILESKQKKVGLLTLRKKEGQRSNIVSSNISQSGSTSSTSYRSNLHSDSLVVHIFDGSIRAFPLEPYSTLFEILKKIADILGHDCKSLGGKVLDDSNFPVDKTAALVEIGTRRVVYGTTWQIWCLRRAYPHILLYLEHMARDKGESSSSVSTTSKRGTEIKIYLPKGQITSTMITPDKRMSEVIDAFCNKRNIPSGKALLNLKGEVMDGNCLASDISQRHVCYGTDILEWIICREKQIGETIPTIKERLWFVEKLPVIMQEKWNLVQRNLFKQTIATNKIGQVTSRPTLPQLSKPIGTPQMVTKKEGGSRSARDSLPKTPPKSRTGTLNKQKKKMKEKEKPNWLHFNEYFGDGKSENSDITDNATSITPPLTTATTPTATSPIVPLDTSNEPELGNVKFSRHWYQQHRDLSNLELLEIFLKEEYKYTTNCKVPFQFEKKNQEEQL
eukprot:TRINITY_DN3919_c0_g2_i5.p1 TRINITY_DN3919_c0_g2~~TRINITY_DN3919_c0_g2_i5.p1  ORF type:complete len:1023 (-),score=210.13 TRINITY_DN3919_c0_g2_i5:928-3996(-)